MTRFIQPAYQILYDESLLNDFTFENLKIYLRYFLCGPPQSAGEGIFYRIIQNREEKCIQCIVFYKTQWFPYHPHDYHPFYIYLDENNNVRFLIIDDGHHFSKLIPIERKHKKKMVNITLFLPDHGLTSRIKASKIFKPKLLPLLPMQLEKWWKINNMAQLKLRTKLIDPWAPGLIPPAPSKKESLIYRINHLLPFKVFSSIEKNLKFTFRDEAICPHCQEMETLDFMPLVHDANGTYFLRKKMMCKNNHSYIVKYNFETGQLQYE